MTETLTQVQIIRSLGEALAWFEKEIGWGVSPSELRSLTGRIGELYVAMVTRGQMALASHQRGYDVVSARNERISVKTVTSSNHVAFSRRTFDLADRVMILRINVDDEAGISIEELFDLTTAEARDKAETAGGDLRIAIPGRPREALPLDGLAITDSATFGSHEIIRYENGTVRVLRDGVEEARAKPILREIAARIGVDAHYAEGRQKNTRLLGLHVIRVLNGQ